MTDSSFQRDPSMVSLALVNPEKQPVSESCMLPTAESWPAFYDAHFDFVWRSVRRLGVSESSLEDATQEVFIVAFRRQADFEGRSSVRTWLYGIAFHVARRFARATARVCTEEISEGVPDCVGPTPQEALSRAQAVRTLYSLLDNLDPDKRSVFVMAELEQLSAPEISEITGVRLNTVYSRLRAARSEFEAALRRTRARFSWRET